MTQNQVQNKFTKIILTKKDTIVYCSIRLGKTKIALDAIEENDKVLWIYPSISMMDGYLEDLEKFPPLSTDITFTTTVSLKKIKDFNWDYIIIDEPQELSDAQIELVKKFKYTKRVGLSGTLSDRTLERLSKTLGWHVGAIYTLEEAIRDGVVKDYKLYLHMIYLDNSKKYIPYKYYGKPAFGTEMEVYKSYSNTMDYFESCKLDAEEKNDKAAAYRASLAFKKYMGLRTNLLYNSISLLKYANTLIQKNLDKKVLIYTLRTDIADTLSVESFHSKNRKEEVLQEFKKSEFGHLSAANCVSTGNTFKNLHTVVFHSYDSNMENFVQKLGRSLYFEAEGQQSTIHTCVLRETQNEKWINKAIKPLERDKTFYMEDDKVYTKLDWIRKQYPGKRLYEVKETGDIVYYVNTTEDGYMTYSYVGSPNRTYNFSPIKLNLL